MDIEIHPAPRLSLIIPVYNVAAYLPACLDSVLAQTRLPDEIIIVDDGATDACPEILRDYAARCDRIRVIRQENGGLSAARNTGLNLATGDYIQFLDSDDRLDPLCCQRLLETAESDQLDMALCNAWYDFEGRKPAHTIYPQSGDKTPPTDIRPGAEFMRARLEAKHFPHMVWMHLYRRDLIERNGFRFVPRLIHEDVIWTTEILLAAQKVRFVNEALVHYRIPIRTSSVEARDKRLQVLIDSSLYNAQRLSAIATKVADTSLAKLIRWQLVDGGLSIFHLLRKISTSPQRRAVATSLRQRRAYRLLFANAVSWAQRRRILRNYIYGFVRP